MDNEKLNPFFQKPKKKFSFAIDFRVIILILLIVIAVMLWLWKPWEPEPVTDRTISVTGQSTVKAVPDEFVFYPSYQFKNADQKAALAELTKKSSEINAKLKEIGLADSQIKSNSSGYNDNSYLYYRESTAANANYVYNLSMTITANSQDQAQKVQDYLSSTGITGSVSPSANFSDSKRKQLEDQGRDEATKDARAKAEQSSKNLHFKIVSVKSVEDGNDFKDYYPRGNLLNGASMDSNTSSTKLQVQPGENDLSYSVTVVYYIR